jgi:protein-tyrosine phosphatase
VTIQVTFVCQGNICRSPMAEGVFRYLVEQTGLSSQIAVDSCGTGPWHVGERPHRGTQKVLRQHGIDYDGRARQLAPADFARADYLIALDSENLHILRRRDSTAAETGLLLDYADGVRERDVPDPYYSGGFGYVYELVEAGCRGLLAHIRDKEGI